MYAIVRAGGRQEKVAVGDTLLVDRLAGEPGDTLELPAVLVVDGTTVTSDSDALAQVKVTAEVLRGSRGPKLTILRYKNKTGYRRRMGHRSHLTEIRVTGIGDEREKPREAKAARKPAAEKPATQSKPAKAEATPADSAPTKDATTNETAAE